MHWGRCASPYFSVRLDSLQVRTGVPAQKPIKNLQFFGANGCQLRLSLSWP